MYASIAMQMDAIMTKTEAAPVAYFGPVKPALTDIPGACAYLGHVSRAKLYADLLPELDVVRFGSRTFVTIESLDRLIAANRKPRAPQPPRHQQGVNEQEPQP
jgi:hypothetical protein